MGALRMKSSSGALCRMSHPAAFPSKPQVEEFEGWLVLEGLKLQTNRET
jgi:hypothetical protein